MDQWKRRAHRSKRGISSACFFVRLMAMFLRPGLIIRKGATQSEGQGLPKATARGGALAALTEASTVAILHKTGTAALSLPTAILRGKPDLSYRRFGHRREGGQYRSGLAANRDASEHPLVNVRLHPKSGGKADVAGCLKCAMNRHCVSQETPYALAGKARHNAAETHVLLRRNRDP
jgi:hypothetical protein